ncbi:MAG: hypothetical protein MJ169_09240 [Treponema sp.]|nr:hypothetical protein [Treponema sp.]
MKKRVLLCSLALLAAVCFTGCFNVKNSPFYDSEWIMQNYDSNGQLYYHHLILQPGKRMMLRSSYFDSSNIIVWRGTYKITSKKIVFNFEDCSRFEDGENVGQYSDKRLVKFYNGDFFYSMGLVEETDGTEAYHLQLIRPKNQIYGENKDIFGNYLEEFVKVEKQTN